MSVEDNSTNPLSATNPINSGFVSADDPGMPPETEIVATVVTGFEQVAADEVRNKLGAQCRATRGSVRFRMLESRCPETLKLRSIDNVYAHIHEESIVGLKEMDKETATKLIVEMVTRVDWCRGVSIWQRCRGIERPEQIQAIAERFQNVIGGKQQNDSTTTLSATTSFRVTCNRPGPKTLHKFGSDDAARAFGAQVNNVLAWIPKMKDYDVEVLLTVDQEDVSVRITLNEDTLFKRNMNSFGPTTMRSTMCYCMLALAAPNPGDVILDAMCGGGSIPLEGAMAFDGCYFVGSDVHEKALKRCAENMRYNVEKLHHSSSSGVDFMFADATKLPYADSKIDAIVTDLPFGKKIGSHNDNRILYPILMREWQRVLKPHGRLVVMTHDKRSWENAFAVAGGAFRVRSKHTINVGGLPTLCAVLLNTK